MTYWLSEYAPPPPPAKKEKKKKDKDKHAQWVQIWNFSSC